MLEFQLDHMHAVIWISCRSTLGCFYDFRQCIWRKIHAFGLWENDLDWSDCSNCHCSISFSHVAWDKSQGRWISFQCLTYMGDIFPQCKNVYVGTHTGKLAQSMNKEAWSKNLQTNTCLVTLHCKLPMLCYMYLSMSFAGSEVEKWSLFELQQVARRAEYSQSCRNEMEWDLLWHSWMCSWAYYCEPLLVDWVVSIGLIEASLALQ